MRRPPRGEVPSGPPSSVNWVAWAGVGVIAARGSVARQFERSVSPSALAARPGQSRCKPTHGGHCRKMVRLQDSSSKEYRPWRWHHVTALITTMATMAGEESGGERGRVGVAARCALSVVCTRRPPVVSSRTRCDIRIQTQFLRGFQRKPRELLGVRQSDTHAVYVWNLLRQCTTAPRGFLV